MENRNITLADIFLDILSKSKNEGAKLMAERIKTVFAEIGHSGRRLAEQLDKDSVTVFKWCTNSAHHSIGTLFPIAECLNVNIKDLLNDPVKVSD